MKLKERSLMIIIGILILIFLLSVYIVSQQTNVVIERLGKFHKIVAPGMHFRVPIIDRIAYNVSMKIRQLDVSVETKTSDDVFVTLVVSVQYKVIESKIYEAVYVLNDTVSQIKSFVYDIVRAQVPLMTLDDVFAKKNDIADALRDELKTTMEEFGHVIIKALVTDINPDANVKKAMNEINTAQRLKIAAYEKGEAEKVIKVKQAEAESEASILHGKGVAGQRQAILDGISQSVDEFAKQTGSSTQSVMDMVLLIQYIDTLKEIGANSKSNVVFIPHSPEGVKDLNASLNETILSANFFQEKHDK